jgi:enamine deaminase RidA (YjgF/YER057c/UK114 family)
MPSSLLTGSTFTKRPTFPPPCGRAGDTLRVSSHAGETPDDVFPADPEEQLRGTFRNIASTLAVAGASWSDVVEINSYHVGLRSHADFLLRVAAEFLEAPIRPGPQSESLSCGLPKRLWKSDASPLLPIVAARSVPPS